MFILCLNIAITLKSAAKLHDFLENTKEKYLKSADNFSIV